MRLTKTTIGLSLISNRTEEGEHDHQTVRKSEDDTPYPSGRMKLVEQQTKRLCGDHLWEDWLIY